jgi:hypothetical protein
MAERQIASNEARLAQLAERERRAYRCGFVGEDAILECRAAKVGLRKAAADEPAAKEAGAVASSILPIDRRKIGIFHGRAALKCGMKFSGGQFFHFIKSNIGVTLNLGREGARLIIVLAGGTKQRQQKDLESARLLWKKYKRRAWSKNAQRR